MARRAIPDYGLYGESPEASLDVGAHIETIEARSRGQNWNIRPHRHGNLYQLLVILDGLARVECDNLHFEMRGATALTLPIGAVHGFRFRPECRGFVVSISRELLSEMLSLPGADSFHGLTLQATELAFPNGASGDTIIAQILALISQVLGRLPPPSTPAVQHLLSLLMIQLKRSAMLDQHGENDSPRRRLLFGFRRLLEAHFLKEKRVQRYAGALGVSPSTLNRACRAHAGASAKALIDARVTAEARRRLRYTRQSLAEISAYLGYRDPAYFSRAFKKAQGKTPGAYRRETH